MEESIQRDVHDYFFTINTRGGWEESPEQPDEEITPAFVARRRRWIIGTPDDAIEQLEAIDEEVGGLGGVMITTHEWVPHHKSRYSMELFARYVMPHFRGHTADLKREWKRTQDARVAGTIPVVVLGRDLEGEFPQGGDRTNLDMHIQ